MDTIVVFIVRMNIDKCNGALYAGYQFEIRLSNEPELGIEVIFEASPTELSIPVQYGSKMMITDPCRKTCFWKEK